MGMVLRTILEQEVLNEILCTSFNPTKKIIDMLYYVKIYTNEMYDKENEMRS